MDKLRKQINMETEEVNKVLIIGAGVTGLALAQGLKKAGIPCVIYEKNESLDTRRNWGFAVHWGLEALEKLLPKELFEQLEVCCEACRTFSGSNGAGVLEYASRSAAPTLQSSTAD